MSLKRSRSDVEIVEAHDPWKKNTQSFSKNNTSSSKVEVTHTDFIKFEKKLFMNSAVSKVRDSGKSSIMSRIDSLRKANQSEEKSEKFNIDSRLVEELGASQLSGKDKREYERKWLQRVGANPEKRNNIPYHILKGMRKKQSIRETKKRNIDIQAGNKPGVSSDVKERTEDRDRGLRRKFGKYKEGVLQLSKDEVMSITGSR